MLASAGTPVCTLPGRQANAVNDAISGKPLRSIAEEKLEALVGIAALKAYRMEGRIDDYKLLAASVASRMPVVTGGETFWKGFDSPA